MRTPVKTGLPVTSAPLEWATTADGILYTAQVPIKPDGKMELGDMRAQAVRTFENLKQTLTAAGGTMDDVTQVTVVITNLDDLAAMNAVYAEYFKAPYPNRATIIAGLTIPGMRFELIVHAHIGRSR